MAEKCSQCGQDREAPGQDACEHCGYTIVGTVALPAPSAPRQSLETAAPDLALGDVLEGKWRVEDKLGEGGMGLVVLALDLQLQRRVAVKILARHLCNDAVAVARFEREARLTAQLDHPNIVPVYAVGRYHERPFIVMKRLEGRSLGELLQTRKGPWPWAEVRPIIEPLCRGLSYLHKKNLVHRDVKPSNVFIGPAGEITLLDFGILKEQSNELTAVGTTLGTLRFMAPEQLTHSSSVDGRADVYSVGVMLYRMLAGNVPFSGPDMEVAQRKMSEDPPSASSINPALSPAVDRVMRRSVSRSANDRPNDAMDLLAELDAAFQGTDVIVRPPPLPKRTHTGPSRLPLLAGLGAGVVLAAGAALFATRTPPVVTVPEVIDAGAAVVVAPVEPAVVDAGAVADVAPVVPDAGPVLVAKLTPTTQPKPRPTPVIAKPVAKEPVRVSIVSKLEGKAGYAQLYVDGRSQGETPTQLMLEPGVHQVRLVREGFGTVEQKVTIQAGKEERLVLEMKR